MRRCAAGAEGGDVVGRGPVAGTSGCSEVQRGRRGEGDAVQAPEGSLAGSRRLGDVGEDSEQHADVAVRFVVRFVVRRVVSVVEHRAAQFVREAPDLVLAAGDAELGDGVSEVVEPTGVRTGEGVGGCAHVITVRSGVHSV